MSGSWVIINNMIFKKGAKIPMKGITTISKVQEKVTDLSRNCVDELVDTKAISFDNLKTIRISGQEFSLKPTAQQLLGLRYGLPLPYLRRCPEEVQKLNLNYWIGQERNEQLFLRFDGDEVRAVFTRRYTTMDNQEILERLSDLGYGHETKVQAYLDQDFFSLSIPDAAKTFGVNGDKITPGISIANSEVGISSLKISAFFLRIVCTNGMISKTQISSSYRHISRKIMDDFPNVLAAVGYQMKSQKDRFKISLETKVEEPKATIQSFNRQFQLSKLEQEAVEFGWQRGEGYTMFHIVNAYTSAAHFPKLSAESSYKLQMVGGSILAMVK
jgi:hypothetical protein